MKPQPFTPQQWKQAGAHFPETSKPSQAQRGKEPAADAPTPPELALIAATLARGRRDNAAGLVERGAELWRAAARASCVEALNSEWQQGHAAQARHLGKGVLERDLEAMFPDPNAEIIMYCGGGYRSVLTAEVAQRMGYRKVFSLMGGYKGLAQANWPMAK